MIVIKYYFVYTDASSIETEVIRELQPKRLLLSYFYFRNKPLEVVCEKIGYKPEIMLDSGAWSAHNKGKHIALTDYMRYIDRNLPYIDRYIALDVIGDSDITYRYWMIMKQKGYNQIPVYHYDTDQKYLERYIEEGETYIALGGSAKVDKGEVRTWINFLRMQYPDIHFHLLGSSSARVVNYCDIESCDSSTWMLQAFNGKPQHIPGTSREAKLSRAKWNMKKTMEYMEVIS